MYLPLAPLALIVVLSIWQLWDLTWPLPASGSNRWPVLRWMAPAVGLAAVLAGLGRATALRNNDYRSEYAIWEDAVGKYPNSGVSQLNFAYGLNARGRLDEAASHCRAAISLNPHDAQAHYYLGVIFGEQGKGKDAVAEFREALKRRPDFADAHVNLGVALHSQGKDREAIAEWRKADQLQPDQFIILSHIAWELATSADISLRDGRKATRLAERAVKLSTLRIRNPLAAANRCSSRRWPPPTPNRAGSTRLSKSAGKPAAKRRPSRTMLWRRPFGNKSAAISSVCRIISR